MEIGAEEPVGECVRDGYGEGMGVPVDKVGEEGRDVDVVGGEDEGADGGDRAPEVRVLAVIHI